MNCPYSPKVLGGKVFYFPLVKSSIQNNLRQHIFEMSTCEFWDILRYFQLYTRLLGFCVRGTYLILNSYMWEVKSYEEIKLPSFSLCRFLIVKFSVVHGDPWRSPVSHFIKLRDVVFNKVEDDIQVEDSKMDKNPTFILILDKITK